MLEDDAERPLRNSYTALHSLPDDLEVNSVTLRRNSSPTDEDSRLGNDIEPTYLDEASTFRGPDSSPFGVGERVSYFSASHDQWLAARVLRPNFNADGILQSYDLDVRKRAEASKIRRALPDFHGDEESMKKRIESFRPTLEQRWDFMLDACGIRWKRATSQGDLLWLRRSIRFVAFAMQPFVDIATGLILVTNHCYLCALVCLCCVLSPYLVLCFAYRPPCSKRYRMHLRAEAFRKAIGRSPGLFGILLTDISVILKELSDTATVEAQNYVTLRHTVSLTESCPWAFFQLSIGLLQSIMDVKIISPYWLLVSIPQSLFNAYTAYSSMVLLGSLAQEGDLVAHLESLIRLSVGAAPPQVLERIMEEKEVIIDEDLRHLNRQGFRSLARAMGRSQVAESVAFRSTGFDGFVNENSDETERANLWAHFCCDFSDNHHILQSVSFSPAVAVPRGVWQEVRRFNMPVLGQVWNGGDLVFERDTSDGPLHFAVRTDDVQALREALEEEFESDLGKVRIASMLACSLDHWRSLQVLLLHTPANVREPMMISHAAENGAKACLKMLLTAQSHPDAKGRGGLTALEMAALKGYSSIVRDLLSAKASPDLCGTFTPLASVAFSNNGEIAQALLEAKANLQHQHRNDSLPLHIAAREGATSVVSTLLQGRAELDPQESKDLMTPLHFAAQRGHTQVVRLLAGHKAEVNMASRKLNSPLHSAAWEGMAEVVQALLQFQADAKSRNGSGCTALDFAMQRRRDDIVQLLRGKDTTTYTSTTTSTFTSTSTISTTSTTTTTITATTSTSTTSMTKTTTATTLSTTTFTTATTVTTSTTSMTTTASTTTTTSTTSSTSTTMTTTTSSTSTRTSTRTTVTSTTVTTSTATSTRTTLTSSTTTTATATSSTTTTTSNTTTTFSTTTTTSSTSTTTTNTTTITTTTLVVPPSLPNADAGSVSANAGAGMLSASAVVCLFLSCGPYIAVRVVRRACTSLKNACDNLSDMDEGLNDPFDDPTDLHLSVVKELGADSYSKALFVLSKDDGGELFLAEETRELESVQTTSSLGSVERELQGPRPEELQRQPPREEPHAFWRDSSIHGAPFGKVLSRPAASVAGDEHALDIEDSTRKILSRPNAACVAGDVHGLEVEESGRLSGTQRPPAVDVSDTLTLISL